jgi:mono/diheme cytochrome c family protein
VAERHDGHALMRACAAALAAVSIAALLAASGARIIAQGATAAPPSPEASARQADASDLAEGRRLFEQKGNCQACHGWSGDGHKTDNQMPDGANLRETKLPRAGLVMTIKCGRLNSQMPAFDKFAYSGDGRCYGKTQADLKAYATRMPDPPATLQAREIDLIVDFMLARIVGQGPMDHAKCVQFWGEETDVCKQLP